MFGVQVVLAMAIGGVWTDQMSRVPTIINGIDGLDTDWPFMCVLIDSVGSCGCVLVNGRRVLTAAHCVDGIATDDMAVVLGLQRSSQVASEVASGDAVTYGVARYRIHPLFSGENTDGDIAVVTLSNEVTFRDDIQPVSRLARKSESFLANSDCWGMGFGLTDKAAGTLADNLQVANMNVITDEECNDIFVNDIDRSVCVFNGDDAESICDGDSGGPLVCLVGGEQVLVGVGSLGGTQCTKASVFTSVASHRTWLKVMGVK
ncbi:hypothetical protein ScPMuIL_009372 [Solemya velum]